MARSSRVSSGLAVLAALLAPAAAAGPARAAPPAYPAAATVAVDRVAVRGAPRRDAPVLQLVGALRRDFHPRVLLAIGQHRGFEGTLWIHVRLQRRPNGGAGWVPAAAVELRPVGRRVIVWRSKRIVSVWQDGEVLLRARAAVGAAATPTPAGRFYVTAKFRPDPRYPVLGAYAVETSAMSSLTDWPGGGIVGIHGTDAPELLGRAVSHGCVRIANADVRRFARLVPLGTPVRVLP